MQISYKNKIKRILGYDSLSRSIGQLPDVISGTIRDYIPIINQLVAKEIDKYFFNSNLIKEPIKDKPLFLIGSGPSLLKCDISKLKNCYTMSFNRSYIAFKDWGFEPTYFAGIDFVVNENNKDTYKQLIDRSNIERFFFGRDQISEDNFTSPRTTLVEIGGDYLRPNIDFTKIVRTANTGLFGLQVALGLLGFKEVYLLGCDANYIEDIADTETDGDKIISKKDSDPNHFRTDYFGTGTIYNKPYGYKYHLPAWKAFYEQVIKNNTNDFKVYNCAKEGKLTFFEFVDFDKIIGNINAYERTHK